MTAYSFWNNKGGVGKTFLAFVAASEYAHMYPKTDVYVIDLCPQANLSEILLIDPDILGKIMRKKPRATIAGYLEARLNSPFQRVNDISNYITHPYEHNSNLPQNLRLICGDNLLEIISDAIRQTSQLVIPIDAWSQVINWVRDLVIGLKNHSGNRETLFIIDCNPSFAIYTQQALVAAENLVVPFMADDSSRRAIENVIALLYGVGIDDPKIETYARISFSKRAKSELLSVPKLHTLVNNRFTVWGGRASKAFDAVGQTIRGTMDSIHNEHRAVFAYPREIPSQNFIEIPDYHSACIIATSTGTPLFHLKPGPKELYGERIQLNKDPLDRYRDALASFVKRL